MTGALDDMGAMREALQLAAQAQAAGEVPVGAVVLKDGVVIGRPLDADATHVPPAAAMRRAEGLRPSVVGSV